MKVSLNLVKKYVDISAITPEEIAHRLTFAGVEVEEICKLASGTNLVVGEVLTCENMPDSDHLHLTTVNAGPKYGILHIVCGAPNVRKGLKVIVATDGAKLPGGTIKKGQIRGHESEGMLCSLLELGVDSKFLSEEQTKGIEELSVGKVGDENVLELLGLDDTILDLKLLANRSDLYSVYNVAKEIGTLFNLKVNLPKEAEVKGYKSSFKVDSLTERCSQFSAMEVKGIKVKESPNYMKEALRSSGIRSINNIVDIGNYVMLLTGQPLHMYDMDKLAKQELIVKDDKDVDFVALDEKTYKLQQGDICITSDDKVMCLGGVMGSLACAVDENTKNVVVEAANFDFASVRRTSIRLALTSDSSQRFVKGINPNQYNEVMALTLSLLKELCDAKENSEVITYLAKAYEPRRFVSSVSAINRRLGTTFSEEEVISSLERAYLCVKPLKGDEFEVVVPDHRIDITSDADLSEEVIRIMGFEHVKSELPRMQLSVGKLEEKLEKKRMVRSYLRGLGLDEQLTYSLINEKEVDEFRILNKEEAYKVMNPLTDEREYVRTNLLSSLFNVLNYNINHGNNNVATFEVSDLYSIPNRHIHLAVVLYGNDRRRDALKNEQYGYYHIKGIVDGLLELFNIDGKRAQFVRSTEKEFHPGRSAELKVDGKRVAVFGELHPLTLKAHNIKDNHLAVLEMDLDALFNVRTSAKKIEILSKFPSVSHDLALVVKDGISSEDIIKEIYKVNRELIRKVEVFDVYRGEHVKEGYYSLALSLTYSSMEKTLTANETQVLDEQVVKALESKFGIELRK